MFQMNKALLSAGVLFLLLGCEPEKNQEAFADMAARDLVDLNEAWRSLFENGCAPEEAAHHIESLILKKLFTIRAVAPSYSPQGRVETAGVCGSLNTLSRPEFPCALVDLEIVEVAREFLSTIEENILTRAREFEKSPLGGVACAT